MISTTVKAKNKRKIKSPTNEISESKQFSIAVLKGFAVGAAALFMILSIFSLTMVKFDYSEKSVPIMAITSAVLSAFIAGFWSAKCIKKKGLMIGVVTSLPLAVIMITFVIVASGGAIGSLAVTTVMLMICFSALGGIMSVNTKSKKPK